jgi:hypothetical protein
MAQQEDFGVVDDQEPTAAAEVAEPRFQPFEDRLLVGRQAGEPVDPAGVTEQQAKDVDLLGQPPDAEGVFCPIELRLLAGLGLKATGRLRLPGGGHQGGPPFVKGGAGAAVARLPEVAQHPRSAETAPHPGFYGRPPGVQGGRLRSAPIFRGALRRQRPAYCPPV